MAADWATFPASYEILVEGQLDPHWCNWLEGLSLEHLPDGNTRITGVLSDQVALRTVVERIFDLNLSLILIRRIS